MRSIPAGKYPLHPFVAYELAIRSLSTAGECLVEALNTEHDRGVDYWHKQMIPLAAEIDSLRAWMTRGDTVRPWPSAKP